MVSFFFACKSGFVYIFKLQVRLMESRASLFLHVIVRLAENVMSGLCVLAVWSLKSKVDVLCI